MSESWRHISSERFCQVLSILNVNVKKNKGRAKLPEVQVGQQPFLNASMIEAAPHTKSQNRHTDQYICPHPPPPPPSDTASPASPPPRTPSGESVGKLFLGPKQRAFLSLMLLLRINIPPLNHSDHGAVCAHDGNFKTFSCGSTAVRGLFRFWPVQYVMWFETG